MSAQRSQPESSGELPDSEVREQNPRRRRTPETANEKPCALLEAGMLEEADHRQNEPDYRDIAARDESFAERCNDRNGAEAARYPGGETCNRYDKERIDPEDKSNYYNEHTDQCQQLRSSAIFSKLSRHLPSQ
jgi:hypothetical protein